MKLIVLLSCLALARAEADLTVYLVNGERHYREILIDNLPSNFNPFSSAFAVDYSTNDLYIGRYDNEDYKPAVFNINTKEIKFINGIQDPQCVAIDNGNRDVYIGTVNGIYRYKKATEAVDRAGAKGDDTWKMYFKGVLYYSKYQTGIINTLANRQTKNVNNLKFKIRNFVLDNDEDIYYVSLDHKLYIQQKGTKDLVPFEGATVNVVAADRYGEVYFSSDDGIYKTNKYNMTVERVVTAENPREITFDSENNIIYYNKRDSKLYRLKPVETEIVPDTTNQNSQVPDVTKEEDILVNKIDNLAQLIVRLQATVDKLQTDLQSRTVEEPRTPQWIRLDTGNLPVCVSGAGANPNQ